MLTWLGGIKEALFSDHNAMKLVITNKDVALKNFQLPGNNPYLKRNTHEKVQNSKEQ